MCNMEAVSVANTSFALDLFSEIRASNKINNIFYSPLSISTALTMVSLGAAGNTATQMSKTLHHHKATDDIHVSYSELMSELNKAGVPYSLSLANRLYGDQTYPFETKFQAKLKIHYNADLETVDFISNAEAACVNINNWVEKQTNEKIKNLLKEGVVNNLSRLVLVNAIYFKGSWESQFKEKETTTLPFWMNKKESKPVEMMRQSTRFPLTYIPEVRCHILEMPYTGKELSMLIMLPAQIQDDTTGLEMLEQELTYENFMEWTRPDTMDSEAVQVSLPRFKLEETYDMKELLVRMGMADAFDEEKCDFSCMSHLRDLALSTVVHKSFVEVNEEGTEAAAATASVVFFCGRSAMRKNIFRADHPFLFFIQHKPTRSILFCGRYCSP